MKDEERIIYVNKKDLGSKTEALKIYGDAKILADSEVLTLNGDRLEPHQIRYRLRNHAYWETETFILKKTAIIKSTRK